MIKLYVFEGRYDHVNAHLGFDQAIFASSEREEYLSKIEQDLPRCSYFSLAGNVESFKSRLRDTEHLDNDSKCYSYVQGDFFGGHFADNIIARAGTHLFEKERVTMEYYQSRVRFNFSYIGDNDTRCGLCISYLNSTTFAISHIEGTALIPEKRQTWVGLSSSAKIAFRETQEKCKDSNKTLEPSQFYSVLAEQIKSKALKDLLAGVFNVDGTLDLGKLSALNQRFPLDKNLDNRDVKIKHLNALLAIGKELEDDKRLQAYIKYIEECAYSCKSKYFDIDFFEDTKFDSKLERIQSEFDARLDTHDGLNKVQRERLIFKTDISVKAIRYKLKAEAILEESENEMKAYYKSCASDCEYALNQSDLDRDLKQIRKRLKEKFKNDITNKRQNIIEGLNKLIELDEASLKGDYKKAHLQKALKFRIAEYKTRIKNLPEDAQVFLHTLTSIKQNIKDEYDKVLAEKLKKETAQLTPNKPEKLGKNFIRRNPYSLSLAVLALLAVAAIALSMTGILPGLSVLALSIAWTATVATGLAGAWKFRKDEIKFTKDETVYSDQFANLDTKINELKEKHEAEKKEALELLDKVEAKLPLKTKTLEGEKTRARAQSLSSSNTNRLFKPVADPADEVKKEEKDKKSSPRNRSKSI